MYIDINTHTHTYIYIYIYICWLDGVKEVLARRGLNIQEPKLVRKIGMNGTVYVGGCDMPLVNLQQDVRSGQVAGYGS